MAYTLETIERFNGVADAYGYAVEYRFIAADDYEDKGTIAFVGAKHADWVKMIWGDGFVSRVDEPWRFGERLSPEWIRRFYNISEA